MSQENVKTIKRAFAAARDRPEEFYSLFDPDAIWDITGYFPGPPRYYGPDGVRDFFRRWWGAFENWGFEAIELIDAGSSVVVHLHQWGRGKGSGVEIDNETWQVWTLFAGKIIHYAARPSREEALEAAGLSE
jgi:hypothetical protein